MAFSPFILFGIPALYSGDDKTLEFLQELLTKT
jgi:hypothetical protein